MWSILVVITIIGTSYNIPTTSSQVIGSYSTAYVCESVAKQIRARDFASEDNGAPKLFVSYKCFQSKDK